MRNDDERKGEGMEQLEVDDPEPTGRATPVGRASRPVTAKPRPNVMKPKTESSANAKAGDGAPAPRSRRAPAGASAKKTGTAAAKQRRPPARSRRPPARVSGGAEASIPPTWSDVGERGKALPAVEVSPILPAPMPSLVSPPDADGDGRDALLPVPVRSSRVSAYAKAALGITLAVSLVFFARGFVGHARHLVPTSTSPEVAAVAAEPAPVQVEAAPIEPTLEAITAPEGTNPESSEGLKHASLEALEHRKLDDAVAAGERATLLDPTDADAWLILGAAYHDQRNFLAARRSYAACAKQATRGEVRECKFLLQ